MRILMLGNSLTTSNGLPDSLAHLLGADIVVHARGGARLAEHLNPDTRLGAKTQLALGEQRWDFVVLQESSNGPVRFRKRFLEASAELCAQVAAAGAQPAFFATWAYAPSCPKLAKLGLSHEAMHVQLAEAYREAADSAGALCADVGTAFFESSEKDGLYRADGVHPSKAGSALAAEVLAGCLKESEKNAAYTVYIVRCEDGSLYTGITTDLERRFAEHQSRGPKAAKYTRTHPAVAIEASWGTFDRAEASALEYRIKRLTHVEKLALVASGQLPRG